MSMISIVGAMATGQARLRERVEVLTRQVSDGQIGQVHGALGVEARRAISLRGDIDRRDAYVTAADTALARMGTAQNVLARLEDISSDLAAATERARTFGAAGVDALANTARAALEEAAALLNTRDDDGYLLAGADLVAIPVPAATGIASGPMATAIAAAVGTLTPGNAATVLADTALAATDPLTRPFSAHLEGPALVAPRRAVQIADGERVNWGVLASQDSTGESTLSWGRELLRGLATLAALTPASAAQGAGYDALLAGVAGGLRGATDGLGAERSALGEAERRVEGWTQRHKDLEVALRAQLGSVEEVDLADASARLRQTEMRLEASYQVTASISRISLAALLG
jgi:flagellin-like hook-associated protein FlgL